jgi:hypothetical protein
MALVYESAPQCLTRISIYFIHPGTYEHTSASTNKGVQCVQFHTLGTVTLGGADREACHPNTYVLDLRLEVSVSDIIPTQASGDCGKDESRKCGGRGDGPLRGEQSPFASFCKPGSDEPPGICRAKCQINNVRPYQPAFSESQRARRGPRR